ncbi:PIN domain-like protein [Cantharellus anzutake]|uniref:PIN domain-like protein n=1 Tax=Cantharellus anzutake TaxID=1750568 RepID=UPI001906AEBB|nr:PIN domain-like protein [Cantharellus anzutake]KAF8328179.1 PIN domain-like protein [Cantharellus anzutake]
MGIQGLLPLLKSIHEHRKLSDFSGKTLAVDGYVWLHRGVYSCAAQLVNGEPTTRYVDFAMSRIRLLLHHNITPYVVFDGGPLPAKRITESRRRQSRQEHREVAMCLLQQGKNNEAYEHLAKAVDVSPELAYQFIKALRAHRVPYIVAPYEADAQLAFLEINSTVDGIITEDSDLLVFGCKLVLFKLDSDGNCMCIRRNRFSTVREISLHGWTDQQFRHMAILAGCDYLPSIPGLGLKTSHRLLRKYKTVERVLQAIRAQSRLKIPPNYLEDFRTAELAFIRQRVYDPDSGRLVCLTLDSIPIEQGCERFIGE